MRRTLLLVAFAALTCLAVPSAAAHIIKSDGCGGAPWVDTNPLDNDLLGPDPDAVVVVHENCQGEVQCDYFGCRYVYTNKCFMAFVEPLGYKVFGCNHP